MGILAEGEALADVFLTQVDLYNLIRWTQGSSSITKYKIYRNAGLTDLIGTVLAGEERVFEDHNRDPNTSYTYYIVGEVNGTPIQQVSVALTTGS